MKNQWLSVSDAAQCVGISSAAIYHAIAQKRLPKRYRQGNLVVSEEAVRNWQATYRPRGRRKGYSANEEQKAKISASQKRRWAQRKDSHQE